MHRLTIVLFLIAGCTGPTPELPASQPIIRIAGHIESDRLDEASGLARSGRDANLFWSMNDDGPAVLYALDREGRKRGRVGIRGAENRDWEDLASFELDGVPYLLVADIGDNETRRKKSTLYVIEEPDPATDKVDIAWRIDFRYPDGARDAESVAVDVERGQVLLLTKRDIPPLVYALPLRPDGDDTVEAERLGGLETLRRPKRVDVQSATFTKDWHWQPTAMDIGSDNRLAIVLTYADIYVYRRDPSESWYEAIARPPLSLGLRGIHNAESIAIAADGKTALVTTEGKNAPVLHIDLQPAVSTHSVTIMTFNVENLFDNADDPGKDDKTYLPIEAKQSDAHQRSCGEIEVDRWRNDCLYLDWSDATVEHKLGVVADAIRQVDDGRGPDILVLQEVENVAILERLVARLPGSDYLSPILLEGDDRRGIDVAFLSRLPLVSEPVHRVASFDAFPDRAGDTREILEASFELPDGSVLTGFSVHFPAPFHPTGMREIAYRHLADLRQALPDDHHAFAAGDFNTTSTEDAEKDMLGRFVRPYWQIAHEYGCEACLGSYYYRRDDNWSYLDMILFSPARGAETTWRIRADSAWIANRTEAQVSLSGTPLRYDAPERRGVSDHWPVVVTLESN
ncbi:MAG: endonuclease/exonuclease/phosphatase family protein [Woeseiaceae bacterium]|nr:endonuclease/exonuclease/phosphatase family protein [Woeseiaceae bacterium]